MSVFIKDGFFCVINKNPIEIPEHFSYRGYAIISSKPSNQEEFDKYSKLSNYVINTKFYECNYNNNHIAQDCSNMIANITKNQ